MDVREVWWKCVEDGGSMVPRNFCIQSLHPEDEGSMVLRNFGILPQYYTSSQPRRRRLESSPRDNHITHTRRGIGSHSSGFLPGKFVAL